jgi:hypothetical protein
MSAVSRRAAQQTKFDVAKINSFFGSAKELCGFLGGGWEDGDG